MDNLGSGTFCIEVKLRVTGVAVQAWDEVEGGKLKVGGAGVQSSGVSGAEVSYPDSGDLLHSFARQYLILQWPELSDRRIIATGTRTAFKLRNDTEPLYGMVLMAYSQRRFRMKGVAWAKTCEN